MLCRRVCAQNSTQIREVAKIAPSNIYPHHPPILTFSCNNAHPSPRFRSNTLK